MTDRKRGSPEALNFRRRNGLLQMRADIRGRKDREKSIVPAQPETSSVAAIREQIATARGLMKIISSP
jgi:hypothetical protein